MNIAHVCTPHGLGHLTRQIALAMSLRKHGCQSTFFCHNATLVHESLPSSPVIHKYADVGIVQPTSTQVDIAQTISILHQRCTQTAIEEWAKILIKYHLVISDMPPLVFAAAQKANVPVLGIGNFDWIWIYQHFPRLKPWAKTMIQWQKGHHAIQLHPGHPLHCSIQAHGQWLARVGQTPLTLPLTNILVGFGNPSKEEIMTLPRIEHVCWILTSPITSVSRKDIKYIQSVPFPSLMNAVDIVFSKAGYGILAESRVSGTPQIWMKRSNFPEARILESFALSQGDVVISSPWGSQQWKKELTKAISSLKNIRRSPQKNDNNRLAQWIMETYSSPHMKNNSNDEQ